MSTTVDDNCRGARHRSRAAVAMSILKGAEGTMPRGARIERRAVRLGAYLSAAILTLGATQVAAADAAELLAWGPPLNGVEGLHGVSCVSTSTCVAVAGNGDIASTTNATAELPWEATNVTGAEPLDGVSCSPTGDVCVAIGSHGEVASTSDPTGAAGAWTVSDVGGEPYLRDVSCPTARFCAAVDEQGDVVISTDPIGGAETWHATKIDPQQTVGGVTFGLEAISCPSETLCVAVDEAGDVVSSEDPSGGTSAWHIVQLPNAHGYSHQFNDLTDVSCVSATFCAAVNIDGEAFIASEPTGPASAWSTRLPIYYGPALLMGISCTAGPVCVAVGSDGQTIESIDPGGGAADWTITEIGSLNQDVEWDGVSCVSTNLCVATGVDDLTGDGYVVTALPTRAVTPTIGRRQTVTVTAGKVEIRPAGTHAFVPISGASTVPDGSEVEAAHGRVEVTVATPTPGMTESAEVYGGRFVIDQESRNGGRTDFVLSLPLTGCGHVAFPPGRQASIARNSKHHSGPKSRRIWASEHGGNWGTTGRYVSTVVEGTHWLTEDECGRSEVQVVEGRVQVRNLATDKTKLVTAGEHYTATARR